jgi:hypothetical protein
MRNRNIGIAISPKKNGEKVPANNFKITLNIIIWPVLDTSTVAIFVQQNIKFYFAVHFLQFLVIKTLDPDQEPDPDWYAA